MRGCEGRRIWPAAPPKTWCAPHVPPSQQTPHLQRLDLEQQFRPIPTAGFLHSRCLSTCWAGGGGEVISPTWAPKLHPYFPEPGLLASILQGRPQMQGLGVSVLSDQGA